MINILYLFTVYFIMNHIIENLINKRTLWQGRHTPSLEKAMQSGYPELDNQLGGGFPTQGVMELQTEIGIGEFRLLFPYLRSRHQEPRMLVYIAPPMMVNSEMLAAAKIDLDRVLIIQGSDDAENLWSAEQCLKSGCCHTVLSWQKALHTHQVKRLQLAAQKGDALQVLFRPQQACINPLPVTLSLKLSAQSEGIHVKVNKRKGNWEKPEFDLNMRTHWPELVPKRANNVLPFPNVRAI